MDPSALKTASEEAAKTAESFNLAKGVKAENVTRRVTELVRNGTEPLVARALAVEAENTQVAKDGSAPPNARTRRTPRAAPSARRSKP